MARLEPRGVKLHVAAMEKCNNLEAQKEECCKEISCKEINCCLNTRSPVPPAIGHNDRQTRTA